MICFAQYCLEETSQPIRVSKGGTNYETPVALLSTGILILLLGAVVPTFAQERHEQQAQAQTGAGQTRKAGTTRKAGEAHTAATSSQSAETAGTATASPESESAKGSATAIQESGRSAESTAAASQESESAKGSATAIEGSGKATEGTAAASQGPQKQQKAPQQTNAMSRHEGSSQRPQRTPQAEARQRREPSLRLSARGQGRIPDDRFHSNFGRGHEFRIGSPRMVDGYSRFQYGGFWFGFVQPWPDDCTTPTTFTSITSTADISFSTHIIPAFALPLAWCYRNGKEHKAHRQHTRWFLCPSLICWPRLAAMDSPLCFLEISECSYSYGRTRFRHPAEGR